MNHVSYTFHQDSPLLVPVFLCITTFMCELMLYINGSSIATATTIIAGITTTVVGILNIIKLTKELKKKNAKSNS